MTWSGKHCGKRRNCSFWAIFSFVTMFSKSCQKASIWGKWLTHPISHITNLQQMIMKTFNPFPHIDAFWRLCSKLLFENIVTQEEIAQNEQFLLLTQCFPLLVIGYPFSYRDFLYFDKIFLKSSAAELSYEGRG